MKALLFRPHMRRALLSLGLSSFSACLFAQHVSFDPIVSTFAGTGVAGLKNGAGDVAQFNVVSSIDFDSKGNAFVVDAKNNCIRKITPQGVVSTFGSTAVLKNPHDLVIDKNDNLYVSDLNNRCIRKITPAGVISLYAGVAGSAAYVDGPKATAKFYSPRYLALDKDGNLYVRDAKLVNTQLLSYIRKVTPDGAVSTLVGGALGYVDDRGSKARFRDPEGMVGDTSGNLYIVDSGNERIRKIRLSDTLVTTVAGATSFGFVDGTLADARFHTPIDIDIDRMGNLYVSDYTNQAIRKISGNYVTTLAGTDTAGFVNGAGSLAKFAEPISVAVDSIGNVFVCDVTNNVIRKIAPQKTAAFTTTPGVASAIQALYVSGDNLDASLLTVKAPQGYEISFGETSGFASQLSITGLNGSVKTTKVFLRIAANNSAGVLNGAVTLFATVSLNAVSSALSVQGTISGPLGLGEEMEANARIYPNPATDELFIETSTDWSTTECQVFSMEGKLLLSTQVPLSSTRQSLDVSGLKEGMYVLKMSNGKQNGYSTFAKK